MKADQFGAFAGAVAQTFKNDVLAYGVWNEPNNPDFLRAADRRQVPWAVYRTLYTKAYAQIKAQQPGARVFIGELSYIGKRDPLGKLVPGSKKRPLITPSKFLERMLSGQGGSIVTNGVAWTACGGVHLAAMGFHPRTTTACSPSRQRSLVPAVR